MPTVDGLQIASWEESTFRDMRRGGLDLVGWTCAVWEGFADTMDHLAELAAWCRRLPDVITQVRTVGDVAEAIENNRVGIFGVFQNTTPIEGNIDRLALFHAVGVRMIQLTYNTQNDVGAGCYEDRDSGLSRFGHEVVAMMNQLGLVIDLSHVGPRTSADAVAASLQPVVYSHVCPASRKQHPRNKTDEEMRRVAECGGLVGVTMFPPFLPSGNASSLDEVIDLVEHVVRVCGEEAVGIGSDFVQGRSREFLMWLNRDKGRGRLVAGTDTVEHLTNIRMPADLEGIADFGNLRIGMERRGWSQERIDRVLGDNWMRVFGEVWRQSPAVEITR
jgi:membrane dipeptidase